MRAVSRVGSARTISEVGVHTVGGVGSHAQTVGSSVQTQLAGSAVHAQLVGSAVCSVGMFGIVHSQQGQWCTQLARLVVHTAGIFSSPCTISGVSGVRTVSGVSGMCTVSGVGGAHTAGSAVCTKSMR